MTRHISLFTCLAGTMAALAFSSVSAQNVDLENLKGIGKNKLLTTTGGVSANSIYYDGNGGLGRDPFIYYINGDVNFNIKGLIDLPLSFNITNYGAGFSYPTLPNRLSLNPKYKWITGHFGDVSMNFSPYTLNGHLFRGAGVDIDHPGGLKVSAMAGQLQRAVEYNAQNQVVLSSYKRFGYGAKVNYVGKKYKAGMTVFAAKDNVNSLTNRPDSLNIFPQQNLVVSWNAAYMPTADLELTAEFANSALTRDLRDTTSLANGSKNFLRNIFNTKNSTSFFKAIKTGLNYKFKNKILGVGYERIDPGYQTLGSYYFNNDLENFTFNFSQPILKQKGSLAANFGYQHDNLDGKKFAANKRLVYSVNVGYNPNSRIYTTASYSNFQTFMNVRTQFQNINQFTQFNNIDTLDYSQISQNANFNLNYLLDKREKINQNININLNYLDAADKHGGIVRYGSASQFFNLAAAYTYLQVPKSFSVTTSFNLSYNTIGKNDFITWGPTVVVSGKIYQKITAVLSNSFNTSHNGSVRENSIFNTRFNVGYTVKSKHNLNCSLMNQYRDVRLTGSTNDFMLTLGYNYRF